MGFERTVLSCVEDVEPTVQAHFAYGTLFLDYATENQVQNIARALKDVVSCRLIVNSRPQQSDSSIDFA